LPFRSVGSLWGKWDLHFHSPSSFDYGNKSVINEEIVNGLIAADIVAVAVSDHHTIDHKRIRALQSLGGAKLTVFPAIELRSELGGSESVHLIGIFAESSDPEYIWTKLQGPLGLTPAEVTRKTNERVYVRFEQAAELIHELGGIVSVHIGRKSNSLENIGNSPTYKQAVKDDLARDHIDLFEIGRTTDERTYREKVFPKIGYEKPLIICSDNHDIHNYKIKSPCWIKGDTSFATFQQVLSDPGERVHIGDLPPAVNRVKSNPTKYLKSVTFSKLGSSNLNEDWFSGSIPLNPGFVSVIGNKGSGKTALVEAIGLLGNTTQSQAFCFLHPSKFRQPRNNKSKHFTAVLQWQDGRTESKSLAQEVDSEAVELVGYIPQNYLETICNEIQTSGSRFEKEVKSVIFSHVEDSHRLGAENLDDLLQFLTEQTQSRMRQLRTELSAINRKIVDFERQNSVEAKQLLLNLHAEKKHELEVHDTSKPEQVTKPGTDPAIQKETERIAAEIEAMTRRRSTLAADIRRVDIESRDALLKRAIADRILGRIRNFLKQYDTFITESAADCAQVSLDARTLVQVQADTSAVDKLREEAQLTVDSTASTRSTAEIDSSQILESIEELTAKLDAPNVEYQHYVQRLAAWEQRRLEIIGDGGTTGSIRYIEKQISGLTNVPDLLKKALGEREAKTREIYRELKELVETYRSLYSRVQEFIEDHNLAAGNFDFNFEADIACNNFAEKLFLNVSQARRGSFAGTDEGRKLLRNLIDVSDFNSEDGVVDFVEAVLDHLLHDRRDSTGTEIALAEQLKKDSREEDVLDTIFSLSYLEPRYSIKWFGKNIEELSPGERGTLLLIFYLLIDRRDTPLIIDQPEENVDNQTVVRLLAPCIKEARKRRQVIIVTHNPNLAVVCDADQVIHCSIDKNARNKVTYVGGALENPEINKLTIDVLEGTRPAFDHRDSKYQTKN
jgi:ABC-type lipoprotein export system ATPase subunit